MYYISGTMSMYYILEAVPVLKTVKKNGNFYALKDHCYTEAG